MSQTKRKSRKRSASAIGARIGAFAGGLLAMGGLGSLERRGTFNGSVDLLSNLIVLLVGAGIGALVGVFFGAIVSVWSTDSAS